MAIDGTKVRELRAERGMSQAALAAAAGTSRQTVNKIEQGQTQPIPTIVAAVARALGVDPDALAR